MINSIINDSQQTAEQVQWHTTAFVVVISLFSSFSILLFNSTYTGNAELHALMEITGAIIGLLAGFAFMTRFYALGNRFHLFVGLAFFINGAEDFIHGLFSIAGTHSFSEKQIYILFQYVPGTYVTGRLVCTLMLLVAVLSKSRLSESMQPKRDTWLFSFIAIFTTVILTGVAFKITLPQFIYPEHFIPRPIDFISACLFFVCMLLFAREYYRSRDSLTWWILLAIGINTVGQVIMSFSSQFYDPFFDLAHLYKIIGYLVPLLGFFLYQIRIIESHQKISTKLSESQRIAHIGSWEHNLETNEVFWSEELFRLLGLDPESDKENFNQFFSMVHPEDQSFLKKSIEETKQSGKPFDIVYRFILKNGQIKFIHAIAVLLPDSAGKQVILSGTAQDITKQIEAKTKDEEKNLFTESLLNLSPDILYIYDTNECRNVFSNEGIQHVLGYSVEEVKNMGTDLLSTLMHPDDFKIYAERILPKYTSAKDGELIIHQYRMKDNLGEWHWLESRELIFKRNPEGTPVQIFGACSDITEHKSAENSIREKERFIRTIHDSIDDGFMVVDRDFHILSANQAFCKQVGMSISQIIGRSCFKVSHNQDQPCYCTEEECAVKNVFDFGKPSVTMHTHHEKDEKIYVETKAYPLMDDSGEITAVVEVIHNVTARHLLEAEQLKTQKLEAIGILAGGIAHDFNNLLQGVFGYVSMAKMSSSRPEKVIEMLEHAEDALSLSVKLTTQLLTFAKGGSPIKKKVNLTPIIENATKFALSGSRCVFRKHLEPDLWPTEVDDGQITQVIQNIVLNASEAMPDAGIVEISTENIQNSHGDRQIRITIRDTGLGIPESYRSKIFDPYFTTKQKGSGLGLATSYSIVKNHGGSIDVVSSQNEGSTFFITLPACEPEALEEIAPKISSVAQKKERRILLMDDEEIVRNVAQAIFEGLGHNIELACHGEEAIGKYERALVSEELFDLVILDLTIKGGMGGEETIRRLLEIDKNVKAIVSSGYSDSSVVSRYSDYGFQGILNKPYTIEQVKECLQLIE